MENVARKLEHRAIYQEYAEVISAGDVLELRAPSGCIVARRAASCLLMPSVGDRVLCVVEERGDAFVLAVLERADDSRATLVMDGAVTLRTKEKLSLVGEKGVDIVGAETVRIAGKSVDVNSIETRIASHAVELLGDVVKADLGKVKYVAKSIDGLIDRVTNRVKRSFRTVEEIDQVKARHLDYSAEHVAHFRGETTVVTAKDLVKVNGEQIHVG